MAHRKAGGTAKNLELKSTVLSFMTANALNLALLSSVSAAQSSWQALISVWVKITPFSLSKTAPLNSVLVAKFPSMAKQL